MMPSLRSVVLCLSAAVVLGSGVTAQRTPPRVHHRSASSEISQDALPNDESLHRALQHAAPAFQDGVFESPRAAVSALTEADPALARQVMEAAKFDLFKRQSASNSSTSASSSTATSTGSTTPSSSSSSTSFSSVSTSSTLSTSSSSTSTSSSSSSTTASPSSTASPLVSSDPPSSVSAPSSTSSPDSSTSGSSSPLSVAAPTNASSVVTPGSSTGSVSPASFQTSSASTVSPSMSASLGSESSSNISSPTVSPTSSPSSSSTVTTSFTPSPTSSTPVAPPDSSTFSPTPTSSDNSSSETDVYVPVPITSVDNGVTAVSTALSARPVTASVTLQITTTNAQGQPITTDTVLPALIYTSTDAQGHTFLVTDLLPGSDPTPTDGSNPTSQANATPRPPIASGAVRSVITETTVVGGAPTVVTKTIVVLPTDAPAFAAEPVEATGTNPTGATPSLQAGAATGMRSVGKEVVALVGAAVGVAILL